MRKPSRRTPGFPIHPARIFHRTTGQTPRAHKVHNTAAQGPAQPEPGRLRPPTAVAAHRTHSSAQERGDQGGVAGAAGQEERHLRPVTGGNRAANPVRPCG